MRAMRVLWALSSAWLLLGIASARAEPSADEAAVRELEQSYAQHPEPALLLPLSTAHERLGNVAQATHYLEEYLRGAGDVADRAALEAHLEELKREPTAEVEPQPAPTQEPVQAAQEPPPADPAPKRSERFTGAMASFAVAGAGAITFGVAGALALKEDKAVAESCGRDAGRTCTDDDLSALHTRSVVADVGLAVLVVGGLSGITLFWLDRRAERAQAARSLRPAASFHAHGGSLLLGGRF